MKNIFDVVETNKMAMEDVSSLIDVEGVALTDLENGRLAVRGAEGRLKGYKYASADESEDVFLIATPELVYDSANLDDFFNKKGKKVRALRVVLGDIFSTTAVAEVSEVGTKLVAGADGMLVEGTGDVEFEVISKRMLGKEIGVTVERVK